MKLEIFTATTVNYSNIYLDISMTFIIFISRVIDMNIMSIGKLH